MVWEVIDWLARGMKTVIKLIGTNNGIWDLGLWIRDWSPGTSACMYASR